MKEYKFKIGGKEYNVTVNPKEGKFYDVTVNGATYEVEAEDSFAPAGLGMTNNPGLGMTNNPGFGMANNPAATPAQTTGPAVISSEAKESTTGAGEKVNSPLPGVIIEVSVKEGQAVKAGQKVAVLEAMKMENEIPAPKDGTITEIHVHKGDSLQEGDPVVTIA